MHCIIIVPVDYKILWRDSLFYLVAKILMWERINQGFILEYLAVTNHSKEQQMIRTKE